MERWRDGERKAAGLLFPFKEIIRGKYKTSRELLITSRISVRAVSTSAGNGHCRAAIEFLAAIVPFEYGKKFPITDSNPSPEFSIACSCIKNKKFISRGGGGRGERGGGLEESCPQLTNLARRGEGRTVGKS